MQAVGLVSETARLCDVVRRIGYAVPMRMEELLWRRVPPSDGDIDQVVAFALRSARPA